MDAILPMVTFALAMACTPGPNNIMLTASGVNFGFRRSLPHMTGIVVGFAALLAACAGGLGLLFTLYPPAHTILKVVGVVYMVWLAWKIANAGRPQKNDDDTASPLTFFQAALFQWVNPKGVLAALSAVTLFVRPQSALPDMVVVLIVFTFATAIAVALWTGIGIVISRALRNPRHARIFNAAMALLLLVSLVPLLWDR